METITIVSETLKQDKNGDNFANVKLKDGRYLNLMFDNFDAYDGPGDYEAEIEKDGKFWKVKPKSLRKSENGSKSELEKVLDMPVKAVPRPSSNKIDTNMAILVQVCIKSAAEVYRGLGKSNDDICHLANRLLIWAHEKLENKSGT